MSNEPEIRALQRLSGPTSPFTASKALPPSPLSDVPAWLPDPALLAPEGHAVRPMQGTLPNKRCWRTSHSKPKDRDTWVPGKSIHKCALLRSSYSFTTTRACNVFPSVSAAEHSLSSAAYVDVLSLGHSSGHAPGLLRRSPVLEAQTRLNKQGRSRKCPAS